MDVQAEFLKRVIKSDPLCVIIQKFYLLLFYTFEAGI